MFLAFITDKQKKKELCAGMQIQFFPFSMTYPDKTIMVDWVLKANFHFLTNNSCLVERTRSNLFSFSLLPFLVGFLVAVCVLDSYWVSHKFSFTLL